MPSNHAIIWIDHAEAHVIHFTPETSEKEHILTSSLHPHLHVKSGIPGSGHAPEDTRYFQDVGKALEGTREILIVGPGQEKLFLFKYLTSHLPAIAENVVAVETVDHPSDAQLLAYARKYFVRVDRLR